MYGNALKNASLTYYETNGSIVVDYHTLTVDYTGKIVTCDVTGNYDATIYMTNCTVDEASVTDENEDDGYYHYGEIKYQSYEIGNEVSYNNVDYYVIKDSSTSEETLALLKKEPLSVSEVNEYGGVGTENNRVNMNVPSSSSYYQKADNQNGYGGMAYYTSETCGYINGSWMDSGCTASYLESDIKYVVNAWKNAKAEAASGARLITYEELTTELGCTSNNCVNSSYSWLYSSNYWYWTSSPFGNLLSIVWYVHQNCGVGSLT